MGFCGWRGVSLEFGWDNHKLAIATARGRRPRQHSTVLFPFGRKGASSTGTATKLLGPPANLHPDVGQVGAYAMLPGMGDNCANNFYAVLYTSWCVSQIIHIIGYRCVGIIKIIASLCSPSFISFVLFPRKTFKSNSDFTSELIYTLAVVFYQYFCCYVLIE